MSEPELQISGGAAGTEVHAEDVHDLARASQDLAEAIASISATCHGMLVDPNVLASAALNPGGVAKFEAALIKALDGPGGLTAMSVQFEVKSLGLRNVATTYETADGDQTAALESLLYRLAGFALDSGELAADGLEDLLPGGQDFDVQRLLADHPGFLDDALGLGPALVQLVPDGSEFDLRRASLLIGLSYPDGQAHAAFIGEDRSERMTRAPQTFGDLLEALDHRNESAQVGSDHIDIREITHADGTRAFIVDIPGTKEWNAPGFSPHTNDLGTNLRILGGDSTTREQAITLALGNAGVGPNDPIMLVGHSQGGMLAAQAAIDASDGNGSFPYNVTHIVTAGAPIGLADVPPNVQVLALENNHDIVPHLDGRENPSRPNLTTVSFSSQQNSVEVNHSTDKTYTTAARALDRSTDPSVAAYRDSASAFFGSGVPARSEIYDLSRVT